MTLRTAFMMTGAALGLLGLPAALAYACTCPVYIPEARYYTVSSITQIEGSGDHAAAESARWGGVLRLTADGGPMGSPMRIWIRDEIADEQLRNVWIESEVLDAGETGDTGGAR